MRETNAEVVYLDLSEASRRIAEARAANDVAALPPIPEDEPPGDDDDVVVSWVREFRRMKGRPPQIPELQAAFPGTPKTTAWRRCKAA